MADPDGESNSGALRLDFDRRLILVVSHDRYVAFQRAEISISRHLFADILRLIADCGRRLIPRRRKAFGRHAFE
jgi:hypothetical protein